jgi:AcrR family transcriptional regulator
MYVKPPTRLTRRESQEATRTRLIDAAEKFFIRYGFDASPVEKIAEAAGFSRGAFYSNFRDKDELFLAVLNRRRLATFAALAEIFRREPDIPRRLRAVRDWYVNQGQQKQWTVLETEFTLRAVRNRTVRARLAALRRHELDTYAALIAQHFSESGISSIERPATIAVALLAMIQGLGTLSLIETDRDAKGRFADARNLAFNRLIAAAEGAATD